MEPRPIQLWHVYFVPKCPYTTPIKDKFVLIACYDKDAMGFLINSKISNWLQNRPPRLVCEAPILAAEHSFLKHDSWVDCQSIFPFYSWDLNRQYGEISAKAKMSVMTAIHACPVLARKYKRIILQNESR